MNPQDRRFLIQNRVVLVQKLNSKLLCDYFFQEKLFTAEILQSILLSSRTEQDKNRHLLDRLPQRGPKAMGIFFKALKIYHPTLIANLFLDVTITKGETCEQSTETD